MPRTARHLAEIHNPLTEIHNAVIPVKGLVIKMPAMKEPVLIVENDKRPMEGPHPTDAEMRKCSVCGFTRRDAPSALKVCCGQPMGRGAVGMGMK